MRPLKRCLGVDLGTSSVKITELAVENGTLRVVRAAMADTGVEPGTPPEERRAALVRTTRELLRKNKFGTKNALFGISGLKVFIRRFRLPATTEERLERIVRYEARQQIPFPLDKTQLQWQFFPASGGAEVDVILVAVRTEEVRDFMLVADKTGLKSMSLGVTAFALFNAHALIRQSKEQIAKRLTKPKKKKKGEPAEVVDDSGDQTFEEVKAYVNLGASSYDLAIARNSKESFLGFTRTPPIGGHDFTRTIMDSLSIPTFADAERIKKTATRLMTFELGFEGGDEVNEDASMAVTDSVDRVVAELRRSLDFYISQPDGMAVDSLELSGSQALLPGIETYIEEKLTIPCSIVRTPPENSALGWSDSYGPITPYMIAVGLGAQGLGISTLTADFLPRERKIARDFPYRTVAVMAALLLGTIWASTRTGILMKGVYEQQSASLNSDLTKINKEITEFREADELNEKITAKFEQLGKAIGQRDYWLGFLATIARMKPVDLLIDQVSMGNDGEVTIRGLSESQASPADFVNALKTGFPVATRAPELQDMKPVKDPRYESNVFFFQVRLNPGDKSNHLNITATPVPSAGQPGEAASGESGPKGRPAPQRGTPRPRGRGAP